MDSLPLHPQSGGHPTCLLDQKKNNYSKIMKIGILTAMQSEHDLLAALLEDKAEIKSGRFSYVLGRVAGNDIVLRQCGIGKVNAAVGTAELIKSFQPQCIISTGVAGGIDTCLGVMDVVVSQKIAYHDVWCGMGCEKGQIQGMPTFFTGNEVLCRAAQQLAPTNGSRIHLGLICTGDQFITDRSELEVIKSNFPAGLACDMESAAIAQTCYIYDVPFVSFRIISDTPGVDNHIDQYENFWGEMASRSFAITRHFLESLPNLI